jgi:hypothetical protein
MEKIKKEQNAPSTGQDTVQKSQKPPTFNLEANPVQKKEGDATTVAAAPVAAAPVAAAPVEAAPVAAAATTVNAADVVVTYGADADQTAVAASAETVIKEICAKAGESSCTITSTARTPEAQARAMYVNLEANGVASQKALYAAAGDQVIDVYVASKAAKKSADEIKADMTAKINELGPSTVSKHCADSSTLCVVDIAPSSITNDAKFIEEVGKDSRVSKFLQPPNDPAYHLEIPV